MCINGITWWELVIIAECTIATITQISATAIGVICAGWVFHCDDSGKNLVQVGFASVGKKYYFSTSCSLDGGETWTGIMRHELSEAGMKKFNFYMSRDSYNIQ